MGDNREILNEEIEEAKQAVTHIDWRRKLTSRKFWVAVCGFITLIMIACGKTEAEAKQVAAIVMAGAVVIGYILGEGLTDAAGMSSASTEYEDDYSEEDYE